MHLANASQWQQPVGVSGEDQARYVVACKDADAILEAARKAKVPASVIGRTGGKDVSVAGVGRISLALLRRAHEGWFPGYMAAP